MTATLFAPKRKPPRKRPTHIEIYKPRDEIEILPPESFLIYYQHLVEACYMTKQPAPEVKTGEMRRGDARIPIRDWRAYEKLNAVDQRLYELRYDIARWLNEER